MHQVFQYLLFSVILIVVADIGIIIRSKYLGGIKKRLYYLYYILIHISLLLHVFFY